MFNNSIAIYVVEKNYNNNNFVKCKLIVNVFILFVKVMLFQMNFDIKIKIFQKAIFIHFQKIDVKINFLKQLLQLKKIFLM